MTLDSKWCREMDEIGKYHLTMTIRLDFVENDNSTKKLDPKKDLTIDIKGNSNTIQVNHNNSLKKKSKLENKSQSVISITDIAKLRAIKGDQIADTIQKLEKAIIGTPSTELNGLDKQKALKQLQELTIASSSNKKKAFLMSLGQSIWESVKNIQSISMTIELLWPSISQIWK